MSIAVRLLMGVSVYKGFFHCPLFYIRCCHNCGAYMHLSKKSAVNLQPHVAKNVNI